MSEERSIPITPIWGRYQRLREATQKERLAEATRLNEHPEELADEFAESVERFASYANLKDHFYPPERAERDFSEEIKRTNDLVLRLEKQSRLEPSEAPNRRTEHGAGPGVMAVPAKLLACDYVDRELLVHRTTSPAKWSDGSRNIGGLRLDILLADKLDRTPIVAELKLPKDMDPFFALIQALACAAHLATVKQYERMLKHLPCAKFPKLTRAPRVDIWVLSSYAADYQPGQRPKGKYMADLQSAADALAPRLLAQKGIRGSIRRIAGLGMKVDSLDAVSSEVRWAWGQSGE